MQATFAAALILILSVTVPASAQTSTQPGPGTAAQARPARGPEQSSVPTNAPPASATQVTGAQDQSPVVKEMNEAEKRKVEEKGK